jgi:HEAT repeat protein
MHCDFIPPEDDFKNFSKQETIQSKFSTPYKSSPFKTPTRTRPASQDLSESFLNSLRVYSTSKKILKNVLEQEWSVNSYSKSKKLKILKKNISKSSKNEDLDERIPSPDRKLVKKFGNYRLESNPFEEYLEKFSNHLENVKNCEFNGLEDLNPDEQMLKLLSYTKSPCRDLKYGAIFSVFLMISENPSETLTSLVLETVLEQLETWQDEDDEYLESVLYLIGFIGTTRASILKIHKIVEILIHDETSDMEKIHQASFSCLFNLGVEGIKCLVDLALSGSQYLKLWILQRLLLTELIQISVIVPALIQDFLHSPGQGRALALAALNRMLVVVGQSNFLDLFLDSLVKFDEKTFIACVVRYFGLPGERALHLLVKKSEPAVKIAALQALSLKFNDLGQQIRLVICENSVESDENLLPGTFWKYSGPVKSAFETCSEKSRLEVNSRDFLAILQRWVRTRTNENKESVFPKIPKVGKMLKDSQLFDFSERFRMRNNVLSVCSAVSDNSKDVRKTAVFLLGQMEIPDDLKVSKYIKIALQDTDSLVRATAAMVSSQLCITSKGTLELLLKLLKDNYPQVRSAACAALRVVGQQSPKRVLPVLMKLVREGSVSRQVVAESIVGLGSDGQVLLIDLLFKEPLGNLGLRTCIIRALGTADVHTNGIDFVIENLFKLAQESTPAVRKAALLSLREINMQAKDKLVYMKPVTLLPLFLKHLKDPSKEIRIICLKAIVELGPQGELVLLEAFRKDSNFIIRAQAAKGLGMAGVRHFKTLILGLHDNHFYVRKNSDKTISNCFSVDSIVNEFVGSPMQAQTIKCAIKEVLALPYKISDACEKILRDVLEELSVAERCGY